MNRLRNFINLNVDRPIVAKIHRSLYYQPFNRQQEVNALAKEWQKTLKNIFMVYTPIVIGYAGGDQSLMKFLHDETVEMNGMYWCYWNKEEPSWEITDLLKDKNGCLVPIESFDEIMFRISIKLGIKNPEKEMEEVTKKRIIRYNLQYDEFEKRMREESQDKDLNNSIVEEMDSVNSQLLKEVENEETAEAYFQKGRIYGRMREYRDALVALTKAIELDPEHGEAYYNRGFVYYEFKEYEKAIADYTKAIELDTECSNVYNNRGDSYNVLKDYTKAIVDYTKAIEFDSKNIKAYINRGLVYINLKKYEKAIEDLTKAIELNPNQKETYELRAQVYRALNKIKEAKKDEKSAQKIDL